MLPDMPSLVDLPEMQGSPEASTGASDVGPNGDRANGDGAVDGVAGAGVVGEGGVEVVGGNAAGAGQATTETAALPEINVPKERCQTVFSSLRAYHKKDQQLLGAWLVLLKKITHALLLRLSADSVISRRSPTYQSLTPKVVLNKVVKYWDGKRHVSVTNPVLNNTGKVTHEVVFATICGMVYQRQPLSLWLVEQFQSGVTVEE